ncbi:hypothetical protein OpiT1DRAFT_01778 [Opitutaceae bacterium TAV1]|nr:hypothetical protein OpiT1DRAFT_01778 [Opitutaceae bacterium TAV1]
MSGSQLIINGLRFLPAECPQNRAGVNRLLDLQIAWNWAYPITASPQTRTRDRAQFRDTTRRVDGAALRARIKTSSGPRQPAA